jgi:hypothetical protein
MTAASGEILQAFTKSRSDATPAPRRFLLAGTLM